MPIAFTRQEVAYLRTEMLPRFGATPQVSDGILLKAWKSGPLNGSPRLPSAVASLVERGLVEVRRASPMQPFRAYWTALGLASLAESLHDPRLFNADRYSHLRAELLHTADQSQA